MLMMLQVVKDGAATLDEAGPLQFHIALKVYSRMQCVW